VPDEPYSIEFLPAARRQLEKLARPVQKRVSRAIDSLAGQPRPHGAKRLATDKPVWRLRVGDYRVLYEIADDRLVVLVIRVAYRRDVYR
jgi:mRNA interferase RelE/StbE